MEDWVPKEDRSNSVVPIASEGVSPDKKIPTSVVVGYVGTTRFNAKTGKEVWHVNTPYDGDEKGTYINYGVVLRDSRFTHEPGLEALNARTGKHKWRLSGDQHECAASSQTIGTIYWCDENKGFENIDLKTGKVINSVQITEGADKVDSPYGLGAALLVNQNGPAAAGSRDGL